MHNEGVNNQIQLGIVLLFFMLINYPLFSIFNRKGFIAGIPILYFYVFFLWAALIVFLIIFIERRKDD